MLRLAQARTYLLLGDGAAAEAELKRATALGVAESETGHLLAHALLLQGQAERAAAEARKAGARPRRLCEPDARPGLSS